uniref:Protein kinase domain-containing protein n=1 Tax=Steinernema glaseri TaxID=37863 RepID=A0A1I7ZYK7_9BILA
MASDSELFVTWEAPDMPTSIEGIVYKLEVRPAGENDHFAAWTVVGDSVDDEAALVKHLEPHGVYQFRVTAKNGFGWGASSLTSRAVKTRHRGAPKISPEHLKKLHFNVLTMPQRDWKGKALTEISEEDEEAEEDTVGAKDNSVFLNTADDFEKRFKLDSELFRGKFSVVRNATDSKCEVNARCVAKIRPTGPEASAEFEALKTSQHDNVVKMIAAYEKEGALFVFQEKLYENIFERFTFNDTYNEEQIAISMRQLAAALQWLHFRGIVHLDVQPTNVMFVSKRSWVLKLIDFGNAQMLDEPLQKPSDPQVQWAAPEVHQADGVVSAQTDMWGLGIICFTLLSGFHPFSNDDDTDRETIEAVKSQKCDPNLIPVQASQEALSFSTWAIKKNPSRRMRTDEALSHRWLSSDPHMARRREGIRYQSSRLRKTAPRTTARKPSAKYLDTKLNSAFGDRKTIHAI